MMDRIILKGLRFHGHIGVFEHEKRDGQSFVVNIEIQLDLSSAGKSDDLVQTISYADVYEMAKSQMEASTCNLIEAYAEILAGSLLRKYGMAERVVVGVDKPNAPIDGEFESMGIVIDRSRHD